MCTTSDPWEITFFNNNVSTFQVILSNLLVKLHEVKVGERRDHNKTTIKVVNEVSFQDFFSKCVYRFLMCNCKYGKKHYRTLEIYLIQINFGTEKIWRNWGKMVRITKLNSCQFFFFFFFLVTANQIRAKFNNLIAASN